jgi:hypothetical protein
MKRKAIGTMPDVKYARNIPKQNGVNQFNMEDQLFKVVCCGF